MRSLDALTLATVLGLVQVSCGKMNVSKRAETSALAETERNSHQTSREVIDRLLNESGSLDIESATIEGRFRGSSQRLVSPRDFAYDPASISEREVRLFTLPANDYLVENAKITFSVVGDGQWSPTLHVLRGIPVKVTTPGGVADPSVFHRILITERSNTRRFKLSLKGGGYYLHFQCIYAHACSSWYGGGVFFFRR